MDATAVGRGQEVGGHGGREGFVVDRRGGGGGFPAHGQRVLARRVSAREGRNWRARGGVGGFLI